MIGKRRQQCIRGELRALSAPLLAVLLFFVAEPYLEGILQAPKVETVKKLKNAKRGESDEMKDIPNEHLGHITGQILAFRLQPSSCDPAVPAVDGNSLSHETINQRTQLPRVKFDVLFLVASHPEKVENREIFRQIYGTFSNTQPFRIKVVFLTGIPADESLVSSIERESKTHGDILQGNFIDHFYNLTFKTIMGYHWAQLFCRNVSLVLKIDDDVFVDTFKFFDFFLPTISMRSRTIYGHVKFAPNVYHDVKLSISKDKFSVRKYPDFCSGFFVVATRDVIDQMHGVAVTLRYFPLEDVFAYGLVRSSMINVQLVHLDVITHYWGNYRDCIDQYRYRCKYFATKLYTPQLLEYYNKSREYRNQLGLWGTINL